jgi:hypothetical protein
MRNQVDVFAREPRRNNRLGILCLAASVCVTAVSLAATPGVGGVTPIGPVATKAKCGPKDRVESGVQGQITLAERHAAGKFQPYNCNLTLIGQATDHGSTMGFAITDKCAYFAKWYEPMLPATPNTGGVVVVDVADSSNPKVVKTLKTPAMYDANESPAVHLGRNLLIAQRSDQSLQAGKTVDIYDVSDCANPALKFSGIIPGFVLHYADITRDGKTLWASPGPDEGDTISALDITDPARPKLIGQWQTPDAKTLSRFHGVSVSDDGNTLYSTIGRHFSKEKKSYPSEGMGVFDVSEVQTRKDDAKITMIGGPLFWTDVGHNQYVFPMTINGRKYAWQNDIDGAVPTYETRSTGRQFRGALASRAYEGPEVTAEEACRSGKPAWGYVSIIDVEDSRNPKRMSSVRLALTEPKNCMAVAYDPTYSWQGYAAANCDVDNYQDAKMMACGYGEAGVRVFDIRNVEQPREIAYYKPAATGSAPREGSQYRIDHEPLAAAQRRKYHTGDAVAYVYFAKGGKEIWFNSYDNGFQVVRFSDELMNRERDLFARDITCKGKLRGRHGCFEN